MEFKFERHGDIVYRLDSDGNRQFVCECRNGYYAEVIPLLLGLTMENISQAIVA